MVTPTSTLDVLQTNSGYLYSFTGLRGDAKKLYQDIVKQKEK